MKESDTRYRCNLLTMIPVDHGVRNRVSSFDSKGTYVDLTGDETGLLLYSNTWQTIRRHVDIFIARYPEHQDNASKYVDILQKCAEQKLLLSENDVRARIVGSVRGTGTQIPAFAGMTGEVTGSADVNDARKIEMIGIPTRNRPIELARCIESYMRNVTKYGRTPEFVVADDSEGEFLEKNRAIISELQKKYSGTISHHDISRRKQFSSEYANKSNIEPDIAEFIVCGDDTDPNHVGALRNFLLLYAAGRKILMVDDDTICTVHTLPGYQPTEKIENITISSMPPRPSWFFDSYEQATSYFPIVEVDYLGEHEKLLGKDVSSLISSIKPEGIQFDPELGGISSKLLIDIQNGTFTSKKVAVTFPGIVGHSWMRAHPPTMVDHTNHPHNLWGSSEEEYKKNRMSPNIARMTGTETISATAEYFAFNLAIDTGVKMPLFPPCGPNEDAVFGHLIHNYCSSHISGFIPGAIEHHRTIPYIPQQKIPRTSYSTWTITLMIMEMIMYHTSKQGTSMNMRSLSNELMTLANLPAENLRTIVLQEIQRKLVLSLEYHRNTLGYHAHAPLYWKQEMDDVINEIEILLKNDLSVLVRFFDDQNKGNRTFGWGEFGEWLQKWGKVALS